MEPINTTRCRQCGNILPEGSSQDGICQQCRSSLPTDIAAPNADAASTRTLDAVSTHDLPDRIGPYKILDFLGEGGMGAVYLAEQEQPIRRKVALKVVKLGMDTKEVIARFESERQALAMMNHPNIAQVHDAGTTERGASYFVMEHVAGIPITDYCDKHRLSTRERLEIFIPVCQAIQHAHQKGIIHRDIKPSNVLVALQDGKPVPKIIDFGIAKATNQRLTEKTVFTQQGYLIGTPEYMSPEQAEMTGLDVDTTTDIYSLGVLLYQLLVGALPFDAGTLRHAGYDEIRRMIREEEPPKPTTRLNSLGQSAKEIAERRRTDVASLAKDLRGDLEWVTMKAMEKDRTRRYASSSELAADIERSLRFEPVLAGPPSSVYRIGRYVRRHRGGVIAAAVVLVAIFIGTAGITIGLLRAVRAEKKAVEEAATAKRVSDFLVDLFKVSDPSKAKGNTITAREILDRGAKKIEEELAGQPPVQARLMETMGTVYRSLGLYPQAQSMLEKTLKLKRSIYGNADLSVADTLQILGIVYDDQGKYDEAVSLIQKSVDIKSKRLKPDDPELARSLNSLAIVFYDQGKYAEAEPLLERSLAIKEKAERLDDADVANTLINLGIIKRSERKYEDSEAFLRRALAISEKKLGDEHPDMAAAILNNLGSLYEDQGRRVEAEPLYLRSLAIWEKILGPNHPDVAIALHNLANLYRNLGKYAQAEPLYLRSLAIWEKTLGPDHPYVGDSLRERANLYRDQGKYAAAEPLYIRSLQILEKSLDENHPDVMETLENYILLLKKTNRAEEALKLDNRLKAIQSRPKKSKS
jgi:serine/threonine protein kinase/tetratricopeptide (TPR) repeat protein